MPEVEFARQTLTFVQFLLLMGVTHEWFHRALVNRLYYAGHHLGRRLLIETGLQPEQWRQNVHRRVLEELERNYVAKGRMSRDALDALNELRNLRRTADYDMVRHIRLRDLNRAVRLFETFASECFRILGVS